MTESNVREQLWTSGEVAKATAGKASSHFEISGVSIDSRTIQPGDLFIALKGPNFDGHGHVEQALQSGAAGCLVNQPIEGPHILVEDTRAALTNLGSAARKRFQGQLLAITGSVGKTTTRALAVAAFSPLGKTHGTKGNLNNHLGVPLTLANMPRDTDYAVIEMGMNHFGEIAHLSELAKPTAAIITAIDWVHSENLDGTLESVAKAKAEIATSLNGPLFAPAPFRALLEPELIGANVHWIDQPYEGDLALPGEENRWNAALVLAALPHQTPESLMALSDLTPQSGRGNALPLTFGGKTITVLDDAYNAAPASMQAAIRNLVARPGKRKIAIVGDMAELANPLILHENFGKFLATQPLDMIVAIGKFNASILAPLPSSILTMGFDNPDLVAPALLPHLQDGDQVLVKASNSTGLSRVVTDLVATSHKP